MCFNNLLTLNEIKNLRDVKQDLDIFFVTSIWDFPGGVFRSQLIKEIRKHKSIKSISGLVGDYATSKIYSNLIVQKYSFNDYLMNLARSRVAIYARGVHNCISFKLGELLALGKPIVGQKLMNNKSIFYANNKYFSDQFNYENPKTIIDNVMKLLNNPNKINEFSKSNAEIFDKNYTPEIIIRNILNTVLEN